MGYYSTKILYFCQDYTEKNWFDEINTQKEQEKNQKWSYFNTIGGHSLKPTLYAGRPSGSARPLHYQKNSNRKDYELSNILLKKGHRIWGCYQVLHFIRGNLS